MKKEGVSLIVLVITIIVMAILAGVVIANLDERNIVDNAEDIVNEANLNTIKDAADVKYIKYEMNKSLLQEGETVGQYIERELIEDGLLTEQEAKYLFFANDGGVKKRVFGDVNCDGVVNDDDATLLANNLAAWNEREVFDYGSANADVNLDGVVTPADSTHIERYLAGWEGYETLPYLK